MNFIAAIVAIVAFSIGLGLVAPPQVGKPIALATVAMAAIVIRIRSTVLVPLKAMSLIAFPLRHLTATNVFLKRDHLKVSGIHAMPYSAQVIKLKPWRNRPNQQLVGVSVGEPAGATSLEVTIATGRLAGCPLPTRLSLVDLLPKGGVTLFRGILGTHREPILSGVAGQDVQASLPLYFSTFGGSL